MKLTKTLLILMAVALSGAMLKLWADTFIVGGLYLTAGIFVQTFLAIAPLIIVTFLWFFIRSVWRMDRVPPLLCLAFIPAIGSCTYANANVQTLITDDCGVSWKLIQAGQSVPARIGLCAYKVTVPDYPMAGDTKFRASFKDRVLANIEVSYEYIISDAKVFIGEAKYIGKPNSETDDNSNASKAYETAENVVIDKRIREAAASSLLTEDIVDFSQAEFEDRLLEASNLLLKNKGVKLNFISFVPTPEEQTRLAIDMMTAMKIYKSRDLESLGQAVAVARAGSAKINLTPSQTPVQAPAEEN